MLKVKVVYTENEDKPEKIRSWEAKGYTGLQEVTCNLIFDGNMSFSRKDRMVANGAMTEAPLSLTYYSIV